MLLRSLSLILLSLPVSVATAQDLTPGHITEARILGLDPQFFTRSELAQISAEETLRERRDRLRFILQMKERRGELPKGFARNEGEEMAWRLGWW